LLVTILAGFATFERHLIKARTDDGRKRAQARGVRFGRPRAPTPGSPPAPRQWRKLGERRSYPWGRSNDDRTSAQPFPRTRGRPINRAVKGALVRDAFEGQSMTTSNAVGKVPELSRHEMITKLIRAGLLEPDRQDDAVAVAAAIESMRRALRGEDLSRDKPLQPTDSSFRPPATSKLVFCPGNSLTKSRVSVGWNRRWRSIRRDVSLHCGCG
jgi:hypothetical protein